MKILVANLGSTSFKYRLYNMTEEDATLLTKGGYERLTEYATSIDDCLQKLQNEGHLKSLSDLDAVGFKTVLGKDLTGCVAADERVMEALNGFAAVAPAHNPPYAEAIRIFGEKAPQLTRVALFETAFYQWAPEAAMRYAVPESWHAIGVRRYGFHGASHKFIAERSAQLLGREDIANIAANLYTHGHKDPQGVAPCRVISCHLGGSSSVCGILNGRSIGASMGFSPQSGLPQNNRVGDLDSGALPYVMKTLGLSLEEAERQMTKEGGLLGVSGVSNDMRDVREAAQAGNAQAQIALDLMVHQIRHWIGAFAFQMGGCDALAFTAGIGEHNAWLREAVCAGLEGYGFEMCPDKNLATSGTEACISKSNTPVKIFVIPANEELVIAREVYRYKKANP